MTLKFKVIPIASLFLALLITGCAKAPDQKLTSAKDAIAQAKSNGAAEYAKQEIDSAQDALDNAINMIQAESKVLPLFRDYTRPVNLLSKAETMAGNASIIANMEKERIRAVLEKMALENTKKKEAKPAQKKQQPQAKKNSKK